MKKKKNPAFRKDLIERLKNTEYAEAYLNGAVEDDDKRIFLLALRDVAEAYGGMSELAGLCRVSREHMYRMLSEKGNPGFASLKNLLNAFGLKLTIEAKEPHKKAA